MTADHRTMLRVPRAEAAEKLQGRIAKGEELLSRKIGSKEALDRFREEAKVWSDYNRELLRNLFTTPAMANEYNFLRYGQVTISLGEQIEASMSEIKQCLFVLRSITGRLELIPETLPSHTTTAAQETKSHNLKDLHQEIYSKCHKLFSKRAYAEAVEKSFKVVRDRLRELTEYETGSEAFGKGKLHIKGAAAPYVDEDFNKAVKFLTMAIDCFRNEKAHTSDAKIEDPTRAYEYLRLSSLAMNLLDNAEVKSEKSAD